MDTSAFSVQDDTIQLDRKIFVGLDKAARRAHFTIGKNAEGDEPQIIYRDKKGLLLYDADGAGGDDPQKFAKIQKNKDLSHDDFFVS
jgi:hypothetical protein